MALDPCPHCPKTFDHDNVGARNQHVQSCQGQANGGDVQPARVQAQDTQPTTPGENPVQTARKDAVKDGVNILGAVVEKVFEHRDRLQSAREQRAAGADIAKVEEYPECECGYQFDPAELTGDEVRCPSCQTLWEVF